MAERYLQAAQGGDDVAQFYLGALYAAGVGRPQSDAEAFQWIHRAAQRGHSQAMLVASGLLALGRGTPKDLVSSYKWAFIVAEASRLAELKNGARQLLGFIEPKLTAEQIHRAKTEAYQFRSVANAPVQQSPPARDTLPAEKSGTTRSAPPPQAVSRTEPRTEPQKKAGTTEAEDLLSKVPAEIRKRYGL